MKKQIITAALLLACSLIPTEANVKQTLTINGQTLERSVTQISFSGDYVVLHFGPELESFPLDVVEISFTNSSGINPLNAFRFNGIIGDGLTISGLSEGSTIILYDATGRKINSLKYAGEETHVNTSALQRGVYMLKAGNNIVKFTKR